MNNLMTFEGNNVEIIEINRRPYFELYSTGMALGQVKISKGRSYPRKDRIDENVKSSGINPVVHNGQLYISEEQLYDLMLEAKTDKCKDFRRWVTNRVLPQIRKTGGYIPLEEDDSETDIMAKALLIAQKTIENKNIIIEYQKPLVNLAEERISKKGCFSITDVTKTLGLKRGKITRWAKEEGYIHKKITEVNKAGEGYFKVYSTDGQYNAIGITEHGLRLIEEHIEEVKAS